MYIHYDIHADALAIQLTEDHGHLRTVQVAPGVHLDFDKQGRLVALELLDASHHMPRQTLEQLPSPKRYLTLIEAAKESRLSAETLRSQIHKGRISAVKRGRDWLVDETALINYLESRDARGRPSAKQARARKRKGRKEKVATRKVA